MNVLDRILHRSPESPARVLFTDGENATMIEAASIAQKRGMVTAICVGDPESAARAAPDVYVDSLVFVDTAAIDGTAMVELSALMAREDLVDGVVFGSDFDVRESARALEHEHPVSASVFMKFPTGVVVALTEDLRDRAVDVAEEHLVEFLGSDVDMTRVGRSELSVLGAQIGAQEIALCSSPDRDFAICEVLRCFAGARAYGPILYGTDLPGAFVRPAPTTDDVLGTISLLSRRIEARRRTRSGAHPPESVLDVGVRPHGRHVDWSARILGDQLAKLGAGSSARPG